MPVTLNFSNMNNAEAFSSLLSDPIDFSLAGDNVLISGSPGQRLSIYRLFLVVDGATELTFKDGLSEELSGPIPLTDNGSIVLDITNVPWFQTSPGNDFIVDSTNSVQVSGTIYYQEGFI